MSESGAAAGNMKMRLENLVIPESKEVLKKENNGNISKRGEQPTQNSFHGQTETICATDKVM